MTSAEYVNAVKDRLVFEPQIVAFHVIRERMTATDAYLRVKATLADGGVFEFAEYVQQAATGETMTVTTYSYYWASADGRLIRRWDNTPHFPMLPGFPHHCHHETGEVTPSEPMNIFRILDEMRRISATSQEERL